VSWLSKVFELNSAGLNWPRALLLLIPANETGSRLFAITLGLEVVALVLLMHGAAIRFWNYALYGGAIAAGVLILVDLPQPSNYGAEGYRVLWTLCGVGSGSLSCCSPAYSPSAPPKRRRSQPHNQPEYFPLRLSRRRRSSAATRRDLLSDRRPRRNLHLGENAASAS
jgi:hypothetical protein